VSPPIVQISASARFPSLLQVPERENKSSDLSRPESGGLVGVLELVTPFKSAN